MRALPPLPGTPWFAIRLLQALEADRLVDKHHGDAPRCDLPVDNSHLVHRAAYAIRRLGAGILEGIRVLVNAVQTLFEVGHDLLRAHEQNDSTGTAEIRPQLTAAHRSREQRPG